ncbi:hypothetical protein BGZ89_002623 [Linnemannia elongata]|nr:hypothetical protein BGZ89_002623 [Linnemannia elongata]
MTVTLSFTSMYTLKMHSLRESLLQSIIPTLDATLLGKQQKLMSKWVRCAMIHMGILGTIDYSYLDKYPECKTMITQVGNIVREYYEDVENIRRLHEMLDDIEDIPEYTMESCTMVGELSSTIDIYRLFEKITGSFQALMEVSHKGIRRKVSRSLPPKKLDRKYTKPTITIRPEYVMIKDVHGKDYMFWTISAPYLIGKVMVKLLRDLCFEDTRADL